MYESSRVDFNDKLIIVPKIDTGDSNNDTMFQTQLTSILKRNTSSLGIKRDFLFTIHEEIIELDKATNQISGYAVIIERPSRCISL